MKNEYNVVAARCAKDNSDYATYLLRLTEREVVERQHRAMEHESGPLSSPSSRRLTASTSRLSRRSKRH